MDMNTEFVPKRELAILPGDATLDHPYDLAPNGFCSCCVSAIHQLCAPAEPRGDDVSEEQTHRIAQVAIGTIAEITARSSCAICRLLTRTLEELCPLYAKANVQDQTEIISISAEEPKQFTKVHISTSRFYIGSIETIDELAVSGSRHSQSTAPPRKLTHCDCCSLPKRLCCVSTELNFDLMNYWIRNVDERSSDEKSPSNFTNHRDMSLAYLLDVKQERLVPANDAARYCALSYVYGEARVLKCTFKLAPQLQRPGSLDDPSLGLSAIIKDAMTLVRQIGERYLWVDSLCIIHDDPAQLSDAISSMGQIYQNSILTIIPLSATSADDRIPGVQPASRLTIPQAEIGGKRIIACSVPLHLQLRSSKYSTRAWTFQEQLLPLRGLYITAHLAYYLAPDISHSEFQTNQDAESKINPVHDLIFNGAQAQTIGLEDMPGFGEQSEWINYFEIVRQYSAKKLTVPLDVLLAFAGIVTTVKDIYKSEFLAGHPVKELLRTMHWVSEWDDDSGISAAKRRDGCPSWSWSGLASPIGWLEDIVFSWWGWEGCMTIEKVEPAEQGAFQTAAPLRCSSLIANTTGLGLEITSMMVLSARLLDPGDGPPQALIKLLDTHGRWCGRICPDSMEMMESIGFANLGLMHLSTSRILGVYIATKSQPYERALFFDAASFSTGGNEEDEARIMNLLLIEFKSSNHVERRGICQLHSEAWLALPKSTREVTLI